MGDKTGIEWTDATWNPVVGCSVVSPGCTNCYAMKMADRIQRMSYRGEFREELGETVTVSQSHYDGTTQPSKAGPVWTGKVAMAPDHIATAPLRWKRPRRIFVNSMGDLFHESVPDEWIDRVFAVMALAPQHTFQILTKRSKRMREYLSAPDARNRVWSAAKDIEQAVTGLAAPAAHAINALAWGGPHAWPLPNVHLGVSAEDQTRADERIPDLLATPAAVRFVSAEPLLGPTDFSWALSRNLLDIASGFLARGQFSPGLETLRPLNWVICGGESGNGARPMNPDWARGIRDQCKAAGVAFFHKQNGEFMPATDPYDGLPRDNSTGSPMVRVGKKAAGSLLDGVEHKNFPAAPAA